jgi:tetratricopeptide (TPR) repeat protein
MQTARVVATLVGVIVLCAGVARGERRNPVERLASEAAAAYHAADYHRAADLLERAYQLEPVTALLYNLGKAYDKLGQKEKAADFYTRYAMADDADPALKVRAEARAAHLREVPHPVALSHPRPTPRPAPPERPPAPKPAPVVVAPTAPPPPHRSQPRPDPRRRDRGLAIGLGAGGVAALGVAIGLSVSALSLHDQFAASLDENRKRALRSDAQSQALAADCLYAVGVAAIGVSAYFLYRWLRPERRTLALAPYFSPTGGGLAAGGRF